MRVQGAPQAAPAIHLAGLEKRFGARTALAGIDLDIEGAGIVGVVGPDGAGKTTLLRAIAGLLDIEARRAEVLGFDLRGDVTALKERLGYVPQAFSLYRELGVMENLRVSARLRGITGDELERRAAPLLERTGLGPFRDRQAAALSGGMKQKLAILSALVSGPKLLILDEPTAGVDVLARDEIWAMLAERKEEVLVVVSTSYLGEMAACDRLVYLDEGRLVADGTPESLRSASGVALYRAWGDDPRAIARRARELVFVCSARSSGEHARIEVRADHAPATVRADLEAIDGVLLVDQAMLDMEATLHTLGRRPQRAMA